MNKWMVWGGTPIFLETPNYTWNLFVRYFWGLQKTSKTRSKPPPVKTRGPHQRVPPGVIPKLDLRSFWGGNSSTKPPFGVTNRRERSLYFAHCTIVPEKLPFQNRKRIFKENITLSGTRIGAKTLGKPSGNHEPGEIKTASLPSKLE